MESHSVVVCAFILALCAFVDFNIVFAAEAEDQAHVQGILCCPRRQNVVQSEKKCECDADCPEDQKCCASDCGSFCVRPVLAKPGVCPRRHWGYGLCVESCSDDSDCPGNEKCCHNGCGHQCTTPYIVKSGRCDLPQRTSKCAEFCYHDGQCPGEQKCCRTTCGHACREPASSTGRT